MPGTDTDSLITARFSFEDSSSVVLREMEAATVRLAEKKFAMANTARLAHLFKEHAMNFPPGAAADGAWRGYEVASA